MEITKSMSRVPLQEGSDFFSLVFPPQGKRWLITLGKRGPTSFCLEEVLLSPLGEPSPQEQGSGFPPSVQSPLEHGLGVGLSLGSYPITLAVLWEVMGSGQTDPASSQCHAYECTSGDKIPQSNGQGRALRGHPTHVMILGCPGSWQSPASLLQVRHLTARLLPVPFSVLLSSPLLPPREKADSHLRKLRRSKGKKTPRKQLLRSKKIVFQNF